VKDFQHFNKTHFSNRTAESTSTFGVAVFVIQLFFHLFGGFPPYLGDGGFPNQTFKTGFNFSVQNLPGNPVRERGVDVEGFEERCERLVLGWVFSCPMDC